MKKYSKNNPERLDLHFKDKFENFEETPSNNVWEDIVAGNDIEQFDQIFNNKFANKEQSPSPQVWKNVQEGIPLNLFVKKHLENLMKVAAVLLCFMSATIYLTSDKNQSTDAIVLNEPTTPNNDVVEFTPTIEEAEVVIEKEKLVAKIKKKKRKKKVRKQKEEVVDVEALWMLLMEEDEELADVFDEDTKLKILSPPVRLPLIEETVANVEAMVVDSTKADLVLMPNLDFEELEGEGAITEVDATETVEPELKIWVPLVVVEKHEIEKLINIYDEAEASKKNNNLTNNQ